MVKRIPLDDAREGMVLCEPAIDSQGRVLLGKGEILSANLIERFEKYGVEDVFVESNDNEGELSQPLHEDVSESAAELAAELKKEMDIRFSAFSDNTLMKNIRTLAEKHVLQARIDDQS